jgi:hypothetical protein
VLGLATLAIAAEQFVRWQIDQQDRMAAHQQSVQRLQEQARQEQASLPAPPPGYDTDKRWLSAATELNLPWLDTLRALDQATKPPVYLLGVKSDAKTGKLVLEAEAPDLDAALTYVETLQAESALRDAHLMAHDTAPDPSGRPFTKVSIQTQWVATP